MNYLRYTDANLYYSMLAHGVDEKTAYDAAEITMRTDSNIDTAIVYHHGLYHHLALVQVADGEEPIWMDLFSSTAQQPRYPICWIVLRWAESPDEIDTVDPSDYYDYLELTEDEY